MRSRIATLAIVCLALPSELSACTPARGVDTHAYFARLARPAYGIWAVSVLAALLWVAFSRRRAGTRYWTWWLVALAVLQPAWWVSGLRGDCGALRGAAALAVALMSLLSVRAAFARTRRVVARDHAAGV